jgi:hypothetical protein
MNARRVPAGIGIIDEPGTPAAMFEQHEHMEPAHRDTPAPSANESRDQKTQDYSLPIPGLRPATPPSDGL